MGNPLGNSTTWKGVTQEMPLTGKAIKALKPGPKALKVSDGNGLSLRVNPNGSKWWSSAEPS